MYDDGSTLLMAEEDDDESDSLFYHQRVLACVALIGYGILESRRIRRDRRHVTQHYLCRPDLLPNPRNSTPWQQLYESHSDKAFITVMGVDVESFHLILASGFTDMWVGNVIPRADMNANSIPRTQRRSLDAAGALALALHHITSTAPSHSLSLIFALVPATVQRYLRFSLTILLSTLQSLHDGRVAWPQGNEFEEFNDLIIRRHPLLTGAFGSMDGLNLPIQESTDPEFENSTYNGWLHAHFISNVFVFAPTGEILACKVNAPGSWNDSRNSKSIYEKLLHNTPDGFYLIADSAFPRGCANIGGRIRAPLTVRSQLPSDENERAQVLAFDRQLLSYRQTAEWGNHVLQTSFGRLRVPLSSSDHRGRAELLEICVRLHNFRTRRVGLNEIRTVYMPLWVPTEVEAIWNGFENRIFHSQSNSRITRYEAVASTS